MQWYGDAMITTMCRCTAMMDIVYADAWWTISQRDRGADKWTDGRAHRQTAEAGRIP